MMPTNQYVEIRNGAYYLAGTRIGLDVLIHDFRRGETADAIFEAYSSIVSLANVYGAITFILEHPKEIEAYLQQQDERYEQFKADNPISPEMIQRIERARELSSRRA